MPSVSRLKVQEVQRVPQQRRLEAHVFFVQLDTRSHGAEPGSSGRQPRMLESKDSEASSAASQR